MIGRISTFQFNQNGMASILDAQQRVSRLQEQIGTGKRVLTPSDDPAAAAQLLNLKSELARVESQQKNIAALNSALSLEETNLDSANSLLIRVRELTIQGQNGTLSSSDRGAIADEIDGLREQLLAIANAKNADGEYIFAGSATGEPAYSANGFFQGTDVVRRVNIGANIAVASGHSGTEVFESISGGANVFAVLSDLSEALRQNEQESVTDQFVNVDAAIEQVSSVRTSVGVRMNWIDDQAALNDNFNLDLQRTMSEIEDLDIADAIGQLQLQMVSLQAAQQTFVKTQSLSLFNYL
jgi:flagellar hook-associated protein 3 FlgL